MSKAKRDAELAKAFKRVFKSEDGQWVLYHLATVFKMFEGTFDENPHKLAFNQGQRNVIAYILTTLEIDHKQILENARRQRQKERQYDEFNFE